ncbi:DUF4401 domain-containing protein [Novosphingobium sp. RD2P27]|uniref:DUF4401 domain-containing protein n=1 Tax=Novosphingobium kalidii TaxID=3230299 RepID=A0ABV2CX30_9SPHN
MNAAELWTELSDAGLVKGAQPEPEAGVSPWYVRLMLGIAGWIGALFLLGFVANALTAIVDDAASALVAGVLCCAAAFALFRTFAGQDFAEQFALALSLAGQGLLAVALAKVFRPQDPAFYFAFALVEAALVLIVPAFLHRLLAACGAAIALALAINELELPGLTTPLFCAALVLVWLDPVRWARGGRLWRPVGYGLVLALMLVETFRLFGWDALFGRAAASGWIAQHGPLLGRGLTSAVLVWVTVLLVTREGFRFTSRGFLLTAGAAVLVGCLCLIAPGLGAALLILLLGFAAGNRLLMAIGILGLLGFAAHFYYSLHATLLLKSGILAVTGLSLLAAFLFLRRTAGELDEVHHA